MFFTLSEKFPADDDDDGCDGGNFGGGGYDNGDDDDGGDSDDDMAVAIFVTLALVLSRSQHILLGHALDSRRQPQTTG